MAILPYIPLYQHEIAQLYHAGFSGDERGGVYTAEYFLEHIDGWISDPTCRCFVATLPTQRLPTQRHQTIGDENHTLEGQPVGEPITPTILAYRIGYAHTDTMPAYFDELGCRDEVEQILIHILGTSFSTFSTSSISTSQIFWLDDLVVTPTSRGCGIGSQLVSHAIHTARQSGYHRLVLYALADDERLARFYARLGFGRFGTFFDHLSHRWQVIYGRELSSLGGYMDRK